MQLLAMINDLWYSAPLIVSVSLVYAATRHESFADILPHALRIGLQIVVFMVAVLGVLWMLTRMI